MKYETTKLQLLACEYMEKTYGKDWHKKNMNQPAITNAFIEGYKTKADEDKTASELAVSKNMAKWFSDNIDKIATKVENDFPSVGSFMGLKVVGREFMPDHLGALVDSEGNILSFIEFEKKI